MIFLYHDFAFVSVLVGYMCVTDEKHKSARSTSEKRIFSASLLMEISQTPIARV
jgi:hypothetical protein